MTSYFVDQTLSATIEMAEAEFMVACCRALDGQAQPVFDVAIGGGAATFAGVESPFSKVIGVGFSDDVTDDELNGLELRHAEHGAPVNFEISTLAEPELAERLSGRGYRLVSFENVLVRPIVDDDGPHAPGPRRAPGSSSRPSTGSRRVRRASGTPARSPR